MKSVLSVLALAAVVAVAITVVSTAAQRAGKTAAANSAQVALMTTAGSMADCPASSYADPSQCPEMNKSNGATATDTDMAAGSCPALSESACPWQCAPDTDAPAEGASNAVAMAETR